MVDQEPTIDDISPEDVREMSSGTTVDWLCKFVMGWKYRDPMGEGRRRWFRPDGTQYVDWDNPRREPCQVSRDARAALTTREWLREQGFNVGFRLPLESSRHPSDSPVCAIAVNFSISNDEWQAYGSDENIATARLLLVLHAEGVL